MNKFDIENGSVSFTIKPNTIFFNDKKRMVFLHESDKDGSVVFFKDIDNKLKLLHAYYGFGETFVELDVSNLSSDEEHTIIAKWSITEERRIGIYIDNGNLKMEKEAKY